METPTTLWILLSIGLPWLGAASVWLIGDTRPRLQRTVALTAAAAGALSALGLAASATGAVPNRFLPDAVWGEAAFTPDGLGVLLAAIAAVIGCLTIVFSVDYMRGESHLARYYTLMLVFIGAMVGLVLSASLLLLFVFWEITAFCSYALIAYHNDDPRAVAAGLKALIMTQTGGLGLLAGILVIYAQTGSHAIGTFLAQAGDFPPALLAVAAFGFLAAAMAKSAQVPFHSWLPAAMEAPTPVSALIHAATMVNAGVYLLARFYPAFVPVPGWSAAVVAVGVISALLAGVMALAASDLKQVLAYSTISQLGYMVYAVGTGAIFASQFHLLSHAVFKALLFLAAGAVIHSAGTRSLAALGGLGKSMPFVRNAFVFGALALAGVPLLNGFWSKELLLEAGRTHGPAWAYASMLAGGGLTALYSVRVAWLVFYGRPHTTRVVREAPAVMRLVLGVLMFLTATTWVTLGYVSERLSATLPFHALEAHATWDTVSALLSAPATYLTLVVSALGFGLWSGRARLAVLTNRLRPWQPAVTTGFGSEWANAQLVAWVQRGAAWLARTQTGQLNWNMAGLVGALAVLLALIVWRLP